MAVLRRPVRAESARCALHVPHGTTAADSLSKLPRLGQQYHYRLVPAVAGAGAVRGGQRLSGRGNS